MQFCKLFMLHFQENVSLKAYNTFGIDVKTSYFIEINSETMLFELLSDEIYLSHADMFIGGGSNLLFTKDFDGLVIKNNLKGITIDEQDDESILLNSQSGEVWHELVLKSISLGYGGLENLSLIPGTVGAAPMQNIGAYGVELKDVFHSLKAVNLKTKEIETFNLEQCRFGYRESIFKKEAKGQYFILSVTLRLLKHPKINASYGAILTTLDEMGFRDLTIQNVSKAIIKIRSTKLPDPKQIGNAGSFFKNPEIDEDQYQTLKSEYPQMPSYLLDNANFKIPAAWLIEQCGWKGKRIGNCGSHQEQALVLVNYGNANGSEVYSLAMDIQKSVKEKFNILIQPEVNIY